MANKSRFDIAISKIKSFFKESNKKAFTRTELNTVLEGNRMNWRLPDYMNGEKFKDNLLSREILIQKDVVFEGYIPNKTIFIVPGLTVFQFAAALINKSYFSHFTSVFAHGLTTQIPKVIYISFEQSYKKVSTGSLTQESIDMAFSKPQRMSTTTTTFEEYTLLIHNSKFSGRTGIYNSSGNSITNIERTLIDIAVRPNYAGGVASVLDIYRNAINSISINKLSAILTKLDFIYPYHQIIGFYLQRAGVDIQKLEVFKERGIEFKFYLTYDIEEKMFDDYWQVYYPKGI